MESTTEFVINLPSFDLELDKTIKIKNYTLTLSKNKITYKLEGEFYREYPEHEDDFPVTAWIEEMINDKRCIRFRKYQHFYVPIEKEPMYEIQEYIPMSEDIPSFYICTLHTQEFGEILNLKFKKKDDITNLMQKIKEICL